MKIAFDNQIFLRQKFGGVSREFCEISNALNEIPGIQSEIFAPIHFNALLKELCLIKKKIYIPRCPNQLRQLITHASNFLGQNQLERFKPDILHETHYARVPWRTKTPRVITVNDMIREKIDKSTERLELKRESVKRADRVICISRKTSDDLHDLIPESYGKTTVIYLGVSKVFQNTVINELSDNQIQTPFILFVGDRAGYKNFDNFLKAFAISRPAIRSRIKLICFGGGNFSRPELLKIHELKLNERVEYITGDDKTLKDLYVRALALVYPSRYEGFGLPPVEAMSTGCPVIASNGGSLPEVLGNAAEFFDPNNVESMLEAINNVIESDHLRIKLRSLGFEQSKKYSWEKTAEEHFKVYSSIATN